MMNRGLLNDKKVDVTLWGLRTKKDLIHEALEELISARQRRDLRDLRGKIAFAKGYDHRKLR